jgi:hypothetical protein
MISSFDNIYVRIKHFSKYNKRSDMEKVAAFFGYGEMDVQTTSRNGTRVLYDWVSLFADGFCVDGYGDCRYICGLLVLDLINFKKL